MGDYSPEQNVISTGTFFSVSHYAQASVALKYVYQYVPVSDAGRKGFLPHVSCRVHATEKSEVRMSFNWLRFSVFKKHDNIPQYGGSR